MKSINQNSDSEAFSKKLQAIITAVKNREKITLDEERLYMNKVLGWDKDLIENIIAINENKNPNLIID
jgi:hypothetical protein